MRLGILSTKAAQLWDRMGMAPLFVTGPTETGRTDSSSPNISNPPKNAPESPKEQPVTDVSDRYVDTTPVSVPTPTQDPAQASLSPSLFCDTELEALKARELVASPDTRLPKAKPFCEACREFHAPPVCTTIGERKVAMAANQHPTEGAVAVSMDDLMDRARHRNE